MKRFEECLDRVLLHEDNAWALYKEAEAKFGPDSNEAKAAFARIEAKQHPKDPGGVTRLGVTLSTFRKWVDNPVASVADLNRASLDDFKAIYHALYWKAVSADSLPFGVDYAVFDAAVNSGPSRAIRFLQQAVGAVVDGYLGPETLFKLAQCDRADVINRICNARLDFLQRLPHASTFIGGWTSRVESVRRNALQDAKYRLPVFEVAQTDTARGAGVVAAVAASVGPVVEMLRELVPLFSELPSYAAVAVASALAVAAVMFWRSKRP